MDCLANREGQGIFGVVNRQNNRKTCLAHRLVIYLEAFDAGEVVLRGLFDFGGQQNS